ncbi:hypothetical protein [Kitasatospora sp. P5_F3]
MTSTTPPRRIALAASIAFIPEAAPVEWRPEVGDLVSDARGLTPLRAPLLVVEVGLYSCNLELWSRSEYRPLTRAHGEVEPYHHNDRELFGYPAQTLGGSVDDVRRWQDQAHDGGLPRAA